MGEATVERDAAASVLKQFGVFSIKLQRTAEAGYPDRAYLLPKGRVLFVEYKRPGILPRRIQALVHMRLAYFGFAVETHTRVEETINAVHGMLNE